MAVEHAGQISTLVDFGAFDASSRAGVLRFVERVGAAPPVVTMFQWNDAQRGAGTYRFVSDSDDITNVTAPLFDVAI